ncbi:tellurite resistance TerB family protein [Actinomarinicola tropica]|uniref:tellurite resistance TerB family protein n=1 Tax=Actinomarinicola tropica TaxID=2789776 RepID=UPI0018999CA2|nr:TerB family tellurite resistance protein [Actinomarinicola tropica]
MIFIWGWRTRGSHIGDGEFYCPNEGGDRRYRLMQARRWFTLFWIPVLPLKVLGEYVECTSCDEPFERKVLDLPTTSQMADALRTALRYLVVAIIRSDEKVTNAERRVALDVMGRFHHGDYALIDLERDIAELEVDGIDEVVARAGATLSASGQERVVRACVELATADDEISDADLDIIATAGRSMGMTPAHIKGVLDEETSRGWLPPRTT